MLNIQWRDTCALVAFSLVVTVAPACGLGDASPGDGMTGDGGGAHNHDGGGAPGDCDVFSPGIAKTGERATVTIMSADPAPPDRGDNFWTLHVTDDGVDVGGAEVTVRPFMPAHGHGTTPADYAAIEMTGSPGEYEVGPFDLFMPGEWELAVSVLSGEATATGFEDSVTFCFEIEG